MGSQVSEQLKFIERCSAPTLQRITNYERRADRERDAPVGWERLDLQAVQYSQNRNAANGYEGIPPTDDLTPLQVFSVRKEDANGAAEEDTPEYEQVMDIPEDCYGAMMMTLVKEMSEMAENGLALIRFVRAGYGAALMTLNLTLQIAFLCSIQVYVVQPSVYRVQELYRGYRADLFDENGVFDADLWVNEYEFKEELCQIALTSDAFLYIILLLWTFTILNEFRQAQTYVLNIQRMPVCVRGGDMLMKDNGSTSIIALTWPTRMLLYLTVVLPKICISAFLYWMGLRWLSATTSLTDLVMNAVAMEFVIAIDDLLYSVILPSFLHTEVTDIDFCVLKPTEEVVEEQEETNRKQISKIFKSLLVILSTMSLPIVYVTFFQDVLPADISDVKEHCKSIIAGLVPDCNYRGLRSDPDKCFPYGGGGVQIY